MANETQTMYVVTKDGYKMKVDTSQVPEGGWVMPGQSVALYDDSTVLVPVWILEIGHYDVMRPRQYFELELIKELRYSHEPSQEEILWALSAYGKGSGDVVFVRKGYELGSDDDDE